MASEIKSVGQYHEVEAQVGTTDVTPSRKGKLSTLTSETTGAVYFRIKDGRQELIALVDDPVKLEQIGLSILAIARLHRG